MDQQRRCARVTHLTFALALRRMLRGDFTLSDLHEETGLALDTVRELVATLLLQSTIKMVRKDKPAREGAPGPRVRVFSLVQP